MDTPRASKPRPARKKNYTTKKVLKFKKIKS